MPEAIVSKETSKLVGKYAEMLAYLYLTTTIIIMVTRGRLKTGRTKVRVNKNMENGRRLWAVKHPSNLTLFCWRIKDIHQLWSLLSHRSVLKCKGKGEAYCVHGLADSINMSRIPKLIYEFNAILIKIPEAFFFR